MNQTMLISGGSRGIGRATALACARAGMDVALAARRTDRLAQVGDEIRALGRRSVSVGADVGEPGSVLDECVRRDDRRAAGVGDDRHARTLRNRLLRQDFSHVEQVADLVHSQHADAAEGSVEHVVAADERPGVTRRRLGCGRRRERRRQGRHDHRRAASGRRRA